MDKSDSRHWFPGILRRTATNFHPAEMRASAGNWRTEMPWQKCRNRPVFGISDDVGHPAPGGRDILLFPSVFSLWHGTCTVIRDRAIDYGEIIA